MGYCRCRARPGLQVWYEQVIMVTSMDFRDVYRFPLKVGEPYVYVRTANRYVAFNNLIGDKESNLAYLSDLIAAINGEKPGVYNASIERGRIVVDGKRVLLARGWGMLIGRGALNLPPDVAARIQDEFIEYCVRQLRRNLLD